jgi:hypothetical protein
MKAQKLTRREFLRLSALTAAGAGFAAMGVSPLRYYGRESV